MANVLIDEQTLKNIADSIRAKSGKTDKMLPSAMSTEIDNLSSGGSGSVETCNVVLSYPAKYNLMYHYVDNGEIKCKTCYLPIAVSPSMYSSLGLDFSCVAKGSYLVCGVCVNVQTTVLASVSGDVECLSDSISAQSGFTCGHIFKINGDCTITIT